MRAKCPGKAHGNAFIDSCGVCAPRWGVVVTADDEPHTTKHTVKMSISEETGHWARVEFGDRDGWYWVSCAAHLHQSINGEAQVHVKGKSDALAFMRNSHLWCECCKQECREVK